ncbi:MAG: hypothetical protein NXI15_02275 [Gammaproteobacteria bacterium]|jgi:hypothetical protein|nr:hypothetical protein [Gammaproteobacteria bacterium]
MQTDKRRTTPGEPTQETFGGLSKVVTAWTRTTKREIVQPSTTRSILRATERQLARQVQVVVLREANASGEKTDQQYADANDNDSFDHQSGKRKLRRTTVELFLCCS